MTGGGGIITAIDWRGEVEAPRELKKRVGLRLSVGVTRYISHCHGLNVKGDAKGKDAKLRMIDSMDGGDINDRSFTYLVSGIVHRT